VCGRRPVPEVSGVRSAIVVMSVFAVLLAALLARGAPAGAEFLLLPTGAFEIVPGESSVTFFVPDTRGGFSGHTTRITGRVLVESRDGGETYTAQVAAAIDTPSITTDSGLRDASMRGLYLRTGQYPTIAFAGTVTAHPGLGLHPFPAPAAGEVTIRDITREERFTATVLALARSYVADVSTSIRMADYGIPYPRAFIFVARDPVAVTLHILARQGGPP
jgi:polyisoprenoid-binding protein YceI